MSLLRTVVKGCGGYLPKRVLTNEDLAKVVDIEDAASGTVRLKQDVDALDDLALEVDSVKTNRLPSIG